MPSNERSLRFENLEERRVLSANGLDTGNSHDFGNDSGYYTSDDDSGFGYQQDDAISYLKVLVNGEERELSGTTNVLDLVAGDTVEVVEIGVHSDASEGVFAAEGYVNKIGDLTSASLIDYNDGRFSDRDGNFAANGGDGAIDGLNNSWTAEAGWDRLTVNLMHYTEAATEVAGRFFVNMQVGLPDFEMDTAVLDKVVEQEISVGEAVTIPGAWLNNSSGLFHNYAEVDIYHDCDPETIVWAGALVGNAGDYVEGEFINTRDSDPFTERWIPNVAGEYTLKYYVDPENINSESNEENNQYEIRLTVVGNGPTAVDDVVEASNSIDVMENDIPTHEAETLYAENFESNDTLTWTTNPNGTDTATSGLWEATDPTGTAWNGVELQLEDAAEGQQAFVTGGEDDGSVGLDDVDNGVTSAISEMISVPADRNAELSFSYTFAHLNNATSEDFFRVSVVGESSTQVVLEEFGEASDRAGEWVEFSLDLADFAGQNIQLHIEAGDLGSGSLVEAGIDNVAVTAPESPMAIHDFTQGQNGTVSLNADGTFNYTPNAGFAGEDTFSYNLTDGENVGNTASVVVNVAAKEFKAAPTASGDEDTSIALKISSDYDQVLISNVPADAFLNRGQATGDGNYILNASDLADLTVTPAENSDVDFVLTATPGANNQFDEQLSQKIEVQVAAVVDGGQVDISDFGILTGSDGSLPLTAQFVDLDGSESHKITLTGLPEFIKLSAGHFDDLNWVLDSSELDDLQIVADFADDTSDWTNYNNRYVYKNWDIKYTVESSEADGTDSLLSDHQFKITTWQRLS